MKQTVKPVRERVEEISIELAVKKLTEIITWATGEDTGMSSISVCRFMLGIPQSHISYPYDRGDRGRCIRLLNLVPAWWDRLDEMSGLSEEWEKQIKLIKEEANI